MDLCVLLEHGLYMNLTDWVGSEDGEKTYQGPGT